MFSAVCGVDEVDLSNRKMGIKGKQDTVRKQLDKPGEKVVYVGDKMNVACQNFTGAKRDHYVFSQPDAKMNLKRDLIEKDLELTCLASHQFSKPKHACRRKFS
jgi:hypothetical protein